MRGSANRGITYTLPKSYPPNTGDKSPMGKSPRGQKSSVVNVGWGQMPGGGAKSVG